MMHAIHRARCRLRQKMGIFVKKTCAAAEGALKWLFVPERIAGLKSPGRPNTAPDTETKNQ